MKLRTRKTGQLNVKKTDEFSHPLHLYINRKDTICLGIDSDKQSFFISLVAKRTESNVSQNATPSPDHEETSKTSPSYPFFPSASYSQDQLDNFKDPNTEYIDVTALVWIEEEIPPDLDEDEGLCISCSKDFPIHYQINQDEDVFIQVVDMFPVQKIVIGVTDSDTFKWLQASKFCTGLLTEVCQHPIFVKMNDVFLASYPQMFIDDSNFNTSMYLNMHVLECCPLRQGILSINTEIILSFISNMKDTCKSPIQLQSPSKANASHCYMSEFSLPLKPSSLVIRSTEPYINDFEFEIVQQKVLWRKLLCKPQKKVTFDPMYVIGMSKQVMLQNGLFEESLVKVTLGNVPVQEHSNCSTFRFVLVKCLSNAIDSANKIFVSPLLIYNLQNCSGQMAQNISRANLKMERYKCQTEAEHDVDTGTVSSSWNTQLPIAKEVTISTVISPNYSPRAIHTEAVKSYFRVPRVLTKGDIIPIRSKDDPEYCPLFSDSDVRYPVVFFKVVKIVGPQSNLSSFICDQNHTRLVQVGSVHSYVPVIAGPYLTSSPLSLWDQTTLPGMKRYADDLENLIRPHLMHRIDNTNLQDVLPSIMLTGPSGCGKTTTAITVARRLNIHVYKVNCHSLYGEASGAIEARIKNVFNSASTYSPCMLLLHSIHALGKDKERNTEVTLTYPRVASSFKASIAQLKTEFLEFPVIVVGTTHSPNNLTADVHEAFLHSVNIEVPNEEDRAEMLDGLLQNVSYAGDLSGQYLAQRTAGFVLGDMVAFVSHAKREAYKRVLKYCAGGRKCLSLEEEESIATVGVVVQQENFVAALDQLQTAHSDTIGAPKIPSVGWEDVGGLVDVKSEILDTIQLPLQYPELLAAGLRRSGVLFYGPPGTGKTLLAKAIATECSLNFLSVKGPELINMYVGQSEQNVREVFERARSASPCVIFFDELDSLAPNRGKSGDSGGVMDRVVSQLLAELDGLHKSCDVFVIGATNRPDLLDPALLRPGRFDKMLYLGVSGDKKSKLNIVRALTRRFQLSKDLDLETVVEKCPNNLTGADFYALCSDAMLNAIKMKIQMLENGETTDQANIEVTEENFMSALSNLTPSISDIELQRYEEMKDFFSNKKQTTLPK